MSIAMLPRDLAESDVSLLAGIGRGQPNQNPFLPPPKRAGGILVQRAGAVLGRRTVDEEVHKSSYIAADTHFVRPPLREGEVEVAAAKGRDIALHSGSAGRRRWRSLSSVSSVASGLRRRLGGGS